MSKNRESTEKKILDAVSRIVEEKDFDSLGINAVAEEAGVGKVLIYRYFGSLEGLLRSWAVKNHYWTGLAGEGTPDYTGAALADVRNDAVRIFRDQLDSMHDNPLLRKIIRWHLTSGHPVSKEIMDRVETDGYRLMEAFKKRCPGDMDLDVHISLLIGGIYYLSLISDRTDVFNGIPLDKGPERIKNGIDQWIRMLFDRLADG